MAKGQLCCGAGWPPHPSQYVPVRSFHGRPRSKCSHSGAGYQRVCGRAMASSVLKVLKPHQQHVLRTVAAAQMQKQVVSLEGLCPLDQCHVLSGVDCCECPGEFRCAPVSFHDQPVFQLSLDNMLYGLPPVARSVFSTGRTLKTGVVLL